MKVLKMIESTSTKEKELGIESQAENTKNKNTKNNKGNIPETSDSNFIIFNKNKNLPEMSNAINERLNELNKKDNKNKEIVLKDAKMFFKLEDRNELEKILKQTEDANFFYGSVNVHDLNFVYFLVGIIASFVIIGYLLGIAYLNIIDRYRKKNARKRVLEFQKNFYDYRNSEDNLLYIGATGMYVSIALVFIFIIKKIIKNK